MGQRTNAYPIADRLGKISFHKLVLPFFIWQNQEKECFL